MNISFSNHNKIPNPDESIVECVKIMRTLEEYTSLVSDLSERNRRNKHARIESINTEP